jgi:hypothetical protein
MHLTILAAPGCPNTAILDHWQRSWTAGRACR